MSMYSTNSRICLLGIALVAATVTGFGSAAGAKPLVVATTTDLADFARNVGGDKVEVFCLLRAVQDPHFVRPTPGAQRKVNQARLFIQTGLDLEIWAPTLLEGARNPNVMVLTATKGIHVLEKPEGGSPRLKVMCMHQAIRTCSLTRQTPRSLPATFSVANRHTASTRRVLQAADPHLHSGPK